MENRELQEFLARFNFREELAGYIGIERERFLTTPDGVFVPRAKEFLGTADDPRWTYELSACQVEDRTAPCRDMFSLEKELLQNDNEGACAAVKLGLGLVTCEVGPADMPLDVYPDARYLEIVRTLPLSRLAAACRVAGTHIHIGVGGIEEALRVRQVLVDNLYTLSALGDHSAGERLRLYKTMAIEWAPPPCESVERFFEVAWEQKFTDNPRNCWHLVRISAHGTVECRLFGVTPHIDEIIHWASVLRTLVRKEMRHAQ